MDKITLMNIYARARKRVEQDDLDIASESEFVAELEQRDLDATMAKAILAKLISRREADLNEMERLLDEMERQNPVSALASGGPNEIPEVTTEKSSADVAD